MIKYSYDELRTFLPLTKHKNIMSKYIYSNNLRQMQKYKVYLSADVDSFR